jgi:hypothetical protein|tara:strand:+ start:729 stop:902 length:174 start_codon:yes stop_codon:yes gene_type:complete
MRVYTVVHTNFFSITTLSPLNQGSYSGKMEIWTASIIAKNSDKSGQAAKKLTKSGQI